jgi:hypothetical protein
VGVNSHVLPGDMVATLEYATLYTEHPEVALDRAYAAGTPRPLGAPLDANLPCLVISRELTASTRGCVFFVMTPDMHFGWLWNFAVRPVSTQHEIKA